MLIIVAPGGWKSPLEKAIAVEVLGFAEEVLVESQGVRASELLAKQRLTDTGVCDADLDDNGLSGRSDEDDVDAGDGLVLVELVMTGVVVAATVEDTILAAVGGGVSANAVVVLVVVLHDSMTAKHPIPPSGSERQYGSREGQHWLGTGNASWQAAVV